MLKIGIGKNAKSEWIELNECEQFSDFGNYIESACKSGIIKNKLAQPYFVATEIGIGLIIVANELKMIYLVLLNME